MCLGKKDYLKIIEDSAIFDNSYGEAYPQTVIAKMVRAHLYGGGEGRKRVLIYGFDGARADALAYILPLRASEYAPESSALAYLKQRGGLYLCYAGGDKSRPETLQETSTQQGWCAAFTGVWGIENGVLRHEVKRSDVPSVMFEAAEKGLDTVFAAIWKDHFTVTYSAEASAIKERGLPADYTLVADENELDTRLAEAIASDSRLIVGINEFPDANGHATGFSRDNFRYIQSVANADRYACRLVRSVDRLIRERGEDWLIIITSDHGGHGTGHGTQSIEDRLVFFASNKRPEQLL